jgi:hypothetical protein
MPNVASLSMNDFDLLEPRLEPVTLGIRKHLEKPNKRIDAAYFPESGFASVVAVQSNGKQPHGKGLLGTTLHYPYEVRKEEEYFEDIPEIKVPGEMLQLAEHILETKAGDIPRNSRTTTRKRLSN